MTSGDGCWSIALKRVEIYIFLFYSFVCRFIFCRQAVNVLIQDRDMNWEIQHHSGGNGLSLLICCYLIFWKEFLAEKGVATTIPPSYGNFNVFVRKYVNSPAISKNYTPNHNSIVDLGRKTSPVQDFQSQMVTNSIRAIRKQGYWSFGLQLTPFKKFFFSRENLSVELVKFKISFFNQLLSDIYFIGPYHKILPPETLLTVHLRMKWSVNHLHDSVMLLICEVD